MWVVKSNGVTLRHKDRKKHEKIKGNKLHEKNVYLNKIFTSEI
jgi:hypothetical protein